MDELERRLRAAMIGASEAAPPVCCRVSTGGTGGTGIGYWPHTLPLRLLSFSPSRRSAMNLVAASYSAHRRLAIAILISVLGDYSGDNCQ